MNYLQKKIDKWCPPHYKAIWVGNPNEPLRFKMCNKNVSVKTLNMIWAEVLSSVTGNNYIEGEHYTRIHSNIGKGTVAISIYPTGTVMFQGKCSLSWLHKNIVLVCKRVKSVIQKPGLSLSTLSGSPKNSPEISIQGLCMVCNKLDTREMLQCQDPQCCSWTHNNCENLTEKEAQNISPYFCLNCRKKSVNIGTDPHSSSSSDEKISLHNSTPTSLNESIPPHKNVDLEIKNISSSLDGFLSSDDESFFQTLKEPLVFESNEKLPILQKDYESLNLKSVNLVKKFNFNSKSFTEGTKSTPISKEIVDHAKTLPIYPSSFVPINGTKIEKLTCFNIETKNWPASSPVPHFDMSIERLEGNFTDKQATSTPKKENPQALFSGNPSTILEDSSNHDTSHNSKSLSSQLNSNIESKQVNSSNVSKTAKNDQVGVLSKLNVEMEPTLSISQAITINTYLQERISKLIEENQRNKNLLHQQACEKEHLEKVVENLRAEGVSSFHPEEHQILYEELLKDFEKVTAEKNAFKEQVEEFQMENLHLKQQNTDFQMELAISYCELEKWKDICERKEREINNILNPPKEINSNTILINDDDFITRSQINSQEIDQSIVSVDRSQGHGFCTSKSNGVSFKNFPYSSQKSRVFYRKDYNSEKYENHIVDFENFKQNKSLQEKLSLNKSSPVKNKTIIHTPLEQNKKICWYAQNNRCKFGKKRCFNFHPPGKDEIHSAESCEATGGGYAAAPFGVAQRQFPTRQKSFAQGLGNFGRTYSSVLRGCPDVVLEGVSQSAPSDQQYFLNKYNYPENFVDYSDIMGGYKSIAKSHIPPNQLPFENINLY